MPETWQQELQNRRIQFLGKSLLNGGASLPFDELHKKVLRKVPGAIGIKEITVKKMAFAVSQGREVTTFAEAEKVRLPLGPQMRRWTKKRLEGKLSKGRLPGSPGLLDSPSEESVSTSEHPLLKSWWERELLPLLEKRGIRGIAWQHGESPEVTLITKVKL